MDLDPEKFDQARQLGATAIINPNEVKLIEAVKDTTDGGADYVFDMVGDPKIIEYAVEVLRPRGMYVVVGSISGIGSVEQEWGE